MSVRVPGHARVLRRCVQPLTRAWPFLQGGGRASRRWPLVAWTDRAEVVRTRLRDGSLIDLHSGDYMGVPVFYTGDFDRRISVLLRRLLRPGDTVLDIGANYGIVALQAARRVGPTGCVHAFEPQAELTTLLTGAKAANHYDHLTVHTVALSDRDGEAFLGVPADNHGGGSMEVSGGAGRDVPCRAAGPLLSGLGLGPIRLLKIDVEGHEDAVLGAAADYLRTNPPEHVLAEAAPLAAGRDRWSTPAFAVLKELGYRFRLLERSLVRLRLRDMPTDRDAWPRGRFDYLASR